MKKAITLFLAMAVVLSLCVCCGQKNEQTAKFSVGFGRVDITPKGSVGLGGYTPMRASQGVMDPLYVTCVAITDDKDSTVLIYTIDTLGTETSVINSVRIEVAQKTGVPEDNLVVSGTHTHSAPLSSGIPGYVDLLTQAAVLAMEDRTPATIAAGSTEIPGMNFVRHYNMADGTVQGDNFGSPYGDDVLGHATQADTQMQIIRFIREGDKKDVLMVNWQAHPKLASTNSTQPGQSSRNLMSADFVGYCRMYVEKNTNCLFAYYTGAAGNLNPMSNIKRENATTTEYVNKYGEKLGGYVVEALNGLHSVETGAVTVRRKMQEVPSAGGTPAKMDITAISIGNIGFATMPFEAFDTNGKQIKEASPYDITFVLSCCNGKDGYVPADYVWDYNPGRAELIPYEVSSCNYGRGTAEIVADSLAQMLNEIAGE